MLDVANGSESLVCRTGSRRYITFSEGSDFDPAYVADWKPPTIRVVEIENFSKSFRNRARSFGSNMSSFSDSTTHSSFSVCSPKHEVECFDFKRRVRSYTDLNGLDDENSESYSSKSSSDAEDGDWCSVQFGVPCSLKYRVLLLDRHGMESSFWHHVSLFTGDGTFNFVCKTPKGSWIDYEIASSENFNPLKLREKNGLPTHFAENSKWNYGFLPQTCFESKQYNSELNIYHAPGAVEVFDIGFRRRKTGEIYPVKPLAALPLVDSEDRLSWRIIAISCEDPTANKMRSLADIEKHHPGTIDDIQDWLRTCNCVTPGDLENGFALDQVMDEGETMAIIAEAHASWQLMVDRDPPLRKWSLPLARPIKPSIYASLWVDRTKNVSGLQIPFSDSLLGSSLRYERAWALPDDECRNRSKSR